MRTKLYYLRTFAVISVTTATKKWLFTCHSSYHRFLKILSFLKSGWIVFEQFFGMKKRHDIF